MKNLGIAGALVATLAGGTALGRFTAASAPSPTVALIGIRQLGPTSDVQHPYYYSVMLDVQQGITHATRDIPCPTDGNPPSLDGYPYHVADALCAMVTSCGAQVQAALPALSPSIAFSNAPDMAPSSTVDAGQ